MKNFIKSKYFTYILAAAFSIAFVAFFIFNPSHAYFQVHKDFIGVNTAKVDLLFDKFAASGDYGEIRVNLDDTWGTPTNPYVIDDTNHISNLSVLQKSGYFNSKNHQCFFVVCTPTGYPVAIDCDGMEIAPIGTPALPFTGSIQGAPLAVTDSKDPYADTKFTNVYKVGDNNFTVTQSTIANLVVAATDSTPDIGFFGRLSYTGEVKDVVTEEKDEDGNVIASVTTKQLTGFAANLDNLLFADVTITTTQNPGSDLENWWKQFTGEREDGTPYSDQEHEGCDETHHLGIIAGHAEWAKITKISVYYSEDVPAFNVGEDTTNYYSIVGLIGTLSYVNPTDGTTAGTATAVGSVSDKQLSEELLSGGGGEGSGMLTGYMLAENIFDRKDADNEMTTLEYYAEAYDVKNMTENNGEPIFTRVEMKERDFPFIQNWELHYYYYFADTIFTFAMSTEEDEEDENAIDYVVKIWPSTDAAPMISLTDSQSDWEYKENKNKSQYIYHLKAATTLTAKGYYVLAYEADDGTIYTFDITNSNGNVRALVPYVDGNKHVTERNATTGSITSMYVRDVGSSTCTHSFIYDYASNVTFTSHTAASRFGVTAAHSNRYWGNLSLSTTLTDPSVGGIYNTSNIYWYDWNIKFNTNTSLTNDVTITGDFTATHSRLSWDLVTTYYTKYAQKIVFDKSTNNFVRLSSTPTTYNSSDAEEDIPADPSVSTTNTQVENLLIYEVVTKDMEKVTANNFLPKDNATEYTFNPSTDVLFCDAPYVKGNSTITSEDIAATKHYTVTPLLMKQWNNGKGQYLESLNHAIKMYQVAPDNFQLTLSNTFIGDWFGDDFDTNAGDVVLVPLGTTGVNFTTPTGMIAFYINEASKEDPSEINIIVAVNPEQGDSTIGLWGPQRINNPTSSFDVADPLQAFALPVSKVAASAQDTSGFTHISGYYYYDEKTSSYAHSTGTDGAGYQAHLGGEVVFVGCTFSVEEPGVYLLGSTTGPMTVAYFSVTGAAGAGGDGTGGSPLGDIDFVYDDGNNTILTVDKKFTGSHVVNAETPETAYYPSYYYIRMIPDADYKPTGANDTRDGVFPSELLYIRRYLVDDPPRTKVGISDRRRIIKLTAADDDTSLLGLSAIYEDVDYDDITTPTS